MSAVLPHLRYLRYVLLHKWYVFRAGLAIGGMSPRWVWRLLVHDLSKFSRAEWGPYVAKFYAGAPEIMCPRCQQTPSMWKIVAPPICGDCGYRMTDDELSLETQRVAHANADRHNAFNVAWLHHLHANPHHWQHWILQQDSGSTLILVPTSVHVVQEMVADWIGAGTKVLRHPSLTECIAETIVWYTKGDGRNVKLRGSVRQIVETLLLTLAKRHGITDAAEQIIAARNSSQTLVLSRK